MEISMYRSDLSAVSLFSLFFFFHFPFIFGHQMSKSEVTHSYSLPFCGCFSCYPTSHPKASALKQCFLGCHFMGQDLVGFSRVGFWWSYVGSSVEVAVYLPG